MTERLRCWIGRHDPVTDLRILWIGYWATEWFVACRRCKRELQTGRAHAAH